MRKLITLEKMKQKQGEDRWNLDKKGGKSQLDINFSAFYIRDYELIGRLKNDSSFMIVK